MLAATQYNHARWCSVSSICKRRVPTHISHWLFDAGSLTKRIQSQCPAPFRVQVIKQYYARPSFSERKTLNLPHHQSALIREVILHSEDIPVVYARTVIPLATLQGAQRRLAHLGNMPLGAVLFSDPNMTRTPMEVTRINPGHELYSSVVDCLEEQPECVWGRRSVFYLRHKPLLVSEIFLPAIDCCERLKP